MSQKIQKFGKTKKFYNGNHKKVRIVIQVSNMLFDKGIIKMTCTLNGAIYEGVIYYNSSGGVFIRDVYKENDAITIANHSLSEGVITIDLNITSYSVFIFDGIDEFTHNVF